MLKNIKLKLNWRKLVLILLAVLISTGGVFLFFYWQDQKEISFIKGLASQHPEGKTFVAEILKARQELKDSNPKNDFSAYLRLGVNFNNLGEKQKALEFYNKALRTDSKSILALNNIAEIYSDSGDYKKAEEYFLKLVEYYSDKTDFYRKLGYLYQYRLNKTPVEIETFFKQGLEKTGNNVDLITWLISYFQEIGDNEKFVEYTNLLAGKK